MKQGYATFHVLLIAIASFWDASLAMSTFQSFMGIGTDGSIVAGTQMPACDSGRKIQIIKLSYHKRVCSTLCFTVTTENVSPEIEDRLYGMCSYKEMCTTTGFSSTSVKRDNITGVNVSYQCLNSKSAIDMRAEKAVYFTTDTHLMGTRPMSFFKDCRCYIEGGPFRITVTDLRLQSKSKRNCSSTILVINYLVYDCSTPDYKNVFNQLVDNSVTRAFISMTAAIENSTAEMVWITLHPEDSSQCSISCHGKPRYTSSNTKQSIFSQFSNQYSSPRDTRTSYSTLQSTNTSDFSDPLTQSELEKIAGELPHVHVIAILSAVGGFVIGGLLTILIVCIVRLRRKRNRHTGQSEIEAELNELPNQSDNTGVTYEVLSENRSGPAYEALSEQPSAVTYEALSDNRPGSMYEALSE